MHFSFLFSPFKSFNFWMLYLYKCFMWLVKSEKNTQNPFCVIFSLIIYLNRTICRYLYKSCISRCVVTCSVNCFIVKLTFFIGNVHLNSRILKIIGGPRFKTKIKVHQSYVKNMRNSQSLGLGVVTNVFPSQSSFSEQSIESTKNSFIHSFILIPNSDHLVLRCTEIIISKQIHVILYYMNTYTCTINICVRKNKLI